MRQGLFDVWYCRTKWNIFPVHHWRIVWMLPPKTASTSIRLALAAALGLPTDNVHELREFQGFHRDDAIAHKEDHGYLVVGSTRHPLLRLASCWADKIPSAHFYAEFTTFDEFIPDMSFVDFVDAVAQIPDEDAEPHFRSLSFDLLHDGAIVPDLLLEQGTLGADWNRVRAEVAWRTSPSIWLPDLTVQRPSSWRRRVGEVPDRTLAMIHERYADDFAAFGYSDNLDDSRQLLRASALPTHSGRRVT